MGTVYENKTSFYNVVGIAVTISLILIFLHLLFKNVLMLKGICFKIKVVIKTAFL
jgi:hypothetical protein